MRHGARAGYKRRIRGEDRPPRGQPSGRRFVKNYGTGRTKSEQTNYGHPEHPSSRRTNMAAVLRVADSWRRRRRKRRGRRAEPEDAQTIIERAVRDGIALAATGAVHDAALEIFKTEWHPARRARETEIRKTIRPIIPDRSAGAARVRPRTN